MIRPAPPTAREIDVVERQEEMHDLPASRDQRHRTHQIPFGNLALDKFGDLAQPVGREADRLGFNDVDVGRVEPRGQEREE